LTRPCPSLDRGDKKPACSLAPRSVIDDQAHDLNLWGGNEKVAFFRGDPAKEMFFVFTDRCDSNDMIWSTKK